MSERMMGGPGCECGLCHARAKREALIDWTIAGVAFALLVIAGLVGRACGAL